MQTAMQAAMQNQLPPWVAFHTHRYCLPKKLARQGLRLDLFFFFFLSTHSIAGLQTLLNNSVLSR